MKRLDLPILICVIVCSCEANSQTKNGVNDFDKKYDVNNSDNQNKTEVVENTINNEYYQIVLSLCDEVDKYEFTEINTEYSDLNIQEEKECFVFASHLHCGSLMGNCGKNIQVYKRIGDKYKIMFGTCGYYTGTTIESNFGYKTFCFESKNGIRTKVYFNGKNFVEEPISVNKLDYNKLKIISNLTDIAITDFVPEDFSLIDDFHTRVKIEKIKIGSKYIAELFIVNYDTDRYFLFYDEKLLFSSSDLLSIETIIDNSKSFYDIKTYSLDNYKMTEDTSYLNPSIYKYSESLKKYEKSQTTISRHGEFQQLKK